MKRLFTFSVLLSILLLSACTRTTIVHEVSKEDTGITLLKVKDADTILIADQGKQISIRLANIDAPELTQLHGEIARNRLIVFLDGKTITYDDKGIDRYGRTLGVVYADGIRVNAWLVQTGNAWVYTAYNKNAILPHIQKKAQEQRLGLWSDLNAIPPWEYRANKKAVAQKRRAAEKAAKAPPLKAVPKKVYATTHWLNSNSGVRHNSSCRWFGNTNSGYYCGSFVGRACGNCGG